MIPHTKKKKSILATVNKKYLPKVDIILLREREQESCYVMLYLIGKMDY